MGNPFALQIFYPDGDPENMRVASKRGWTGNIFYISREYWPDGAREYDEELKMPGVYILAGRGESSEDNEDDSQFIYIGQAENLHTRIQQHSQDVKKSFWQIVVCVTGGTDFNNAHFRWMESHLIKLARKIEKCVVENENTPNEPQIAKSEEVEVKSFLRETLQILPVVEIDAFVEPKRVNLKLSDQKNKQNSGKDNDRVKPGNEKTSELKERILSTFQQNENIDLLKVSRAKFYDKSQKFRICCAVSKKHDNQQWWFGVQKNWIDFLERGEKGYLIFGMHENSKVISFPVKEFNKIKDKLNPKLNEERETILWHLHINEIKGNLQFKLKGRMERFYIPPEYIIDIT